MTRKVFDGLKAGLDDALAFAKGDSSRGRLYRVTDVKALRESLAMSQEEFASAYHVPVGTLRNYEQRRRLPSGPAAAYFALIAHKPVAMRRLLREALQAPPRKTASRRLATR